MMRDVTWVQMRQRMWARAKQAAEDLKRGPLDDHDWIFRYYNDVPILLNEIDRLRKLKRGK